MPAISTISSEKLSRLIGIPGGPAIIDVRTEEAFAKDPRLIPGAVRRSHEDVAEWAGEYQGRSVVVNCHHGRELSQGVAAWLRHAGASAEALEGGAAGWAGAGLPMIPQAILPGRNAHGQTVWVTRARPKVDRIACPWLIRRFVDPNAIFLFVAPSEVESVAERFGAAAFDIEGAGVFWSHRGERCTFDTMIEELGLGSMPALQRLATIVRGADTGHLDIAPQAAGLLAASLGLSRIYSDDLQQLNAGMLLYDAFYRWCRDAVDETHDWASHRPRTTVRS